MKIVHQFENYYYDADKNELFLSMSKRQIFPNKEGNFVLKKNGKATELTVDKLKTLSAYRCVKIKRTLPEESPRDKKARKKLLVIEDLKNKTKLRDIQKKHGVCYCTIVKIREELKLC
jgi:hypothetical protein